MPHLSSLQSWSPAALFLNITLRKSFIRYSLNNISTYSATAFVTLIVFTCLVNISYSGFYCTHRTSCIQILIRPAESARWNLTRSYNAKKCNPNTYFTISPRPARYNTIQEVTISSSYIRAYVKTLINKF